MMKKLLGLLCLLLCTNVVSAQSNTTAKDALDVVIKSFGTFDTTVAFGMLSGDMAIALPNKIRRDAKEETPANFYKKVEDTRVMFLTIEVVNTYSTYTITAFEILHKKHANDENLTKGFMVFKKIKGLWYLERVTKNAESVILAYPVLQGKMPVQAKKDEIKQE
ncbi:MAG: hypothetical protein M0D57_17670 [Sphingobacteriales bacterium JAD_PAG50586_3]|nr:MAG: hypothetical protein M0D57_17670 [Sphingobacteriales bacterium JAD_PAG50586_3]